MRKNPVLIFFAVVALLIGSAAIYIQSAAFANQLKRVLAKYVPRNLGISADFSNLSIQVFPPGVGIVNPRIDALEKNAANLPPGTHIEAERMALTFRPVQILSGRISIHEVRIQNGKIRTTLIPAPVEQKKKRSMRLSWQDLFEVQAEKVALENTSVELELPSMKSRVKFNAKNVEVEKVVDKDTFYDVLVHLGELEAETPPNFPYPKTIDSLRLVARVGSGGLSIKEFELVRDGTQAVANGEVTGDVLRGTQLKADVALRLNGDLARMFDFLTKGKSGSDLPQGHIGFDGRAKMELDRIPETLSASGTLKGENLSYHHYRFDQAEVEGSYTSPGNGNSVADELIVKRAVLQSREIPKKGGRQPGSGGVIEIGAFRYNLEKPTPIETTVTLKRAHLLWLGAELLEELYSLDGRVTGETKIRFTPKSATTSFNLQADVDWKIEGLQIDNQRFGEDKPLNRIISLEHSALKGAVNVNSERVQFNGMNIGMVTTQLAVEGDIGFANGKTNYNISGAGPVDFKEFGILAETPIEGLGPLSIRVHGPADQVYLDFDGSFQKFRYLSMDFGDFRGRVTWDESKSQLLFRNLDCNRGRTKYRLDGKIDLGAKDAMDLKAVIPAGGNVNEFLTIFSEITKNYWWFPTSLHGDMQASLRIHGGVSLSEMIIDADIDGSRWEYFGERFSKVRLRGGYDKGRYFFTGFEATKRQGRLFGSASVDAKSVYDWKISSEGLALNDMDHIASLDIPFRGVVTASSYGKGTPSNLESKTELRLTSLILRGKRMDDSSLTIESKAGRAKIEGSGLGDRATLRALYDFTPNRESFLEVKANKFDFSPLILLLNPVLMQDEQLAGSVSGGFRLDFLTDHAEVGSGQGTISQYLLKKTGTTFKLDRPYDFKIDRGSFSIPALTLVGDEGSSTLSLRSNSGALAGTLRGNMDLSITEFFTSAIEKADGVATLDLDISGTVKEPKLEGSGEIKNGMVRIPGIETPVENIHGSFEMEEGLLSLESFESDLASARATLEGTMEFAFAKWPTMDLTLGLNGNKLKFYPFQVAKLRGKLNVTGDHRPYLVGGKILVETATSREKITSARGPGLRSVQYLPPPTALSSSVIPMFKLDIAVSAPGNIFIQNELMDVEAKGDLRIVGTIENPSPLGTASAVQGKILFKDRAFQIQNAIMEFDNPSVINPRYEVLAFTEVANRRIQLFSSGRFDKQKFEFSSNPPMPEPEILNLLALGVTGDETRKFRSTDRSAYEQGEAASLVLHSLDFNREVQNKTGFQIAIDEAIDERTGTSAFSRATNADTATAPKIVIKRQFGQRFGISAGSTVGVGTSVQREVNAEVKVTKGLSVIGVWDSIEGVTAEDPKRNSFGIDLKLQKRFK